ncbi:Sema5b [Symbiodinium pilosum]|uniref:Sema5b protein n=1 Tax=Symbiodinium pilosum TaxID=2952 RepID=A0A812T2E4_SYMPI|nr:Sema5b [Symbiodinium pilosum]
MFSAKLPLHWFCLCLPFASATLPALEIDDECQSGECALEAIQLKGEMAEHLDADEGCQDVRSGDCLVDVVWAKNEGIRGHPDWYPGLSPESSMADFQCQLYKANPAKCPKPCSAPCPGPVRQPSKAPEREAPTCEGKEQPDACLCVFDIDRTLTSKQGQQDVCPGSSPSAGIVDTAYGGGDLVLSALGAAGMAGTFCQKCYLGLCSHGDGSGANSRERKELLQKVLRSEAMDNFKMKPYNAAWSDMKLLSPFVVAQPDGRKQDAVFQILEWYAVQEVCIPKGNTYFFDDKDVNIRPFRGTGLNARQISCNSRDPKLGWGEVGDLTALLLEGG